MDANKIFFQQKRFDLIFKYLYVSHPCDYNIKAYIENIRAFNAFKEESTGGVTKENPADFLSIFDSLIKDIREHNFDENISRIRINEHGELIDGAHRLSICTCFGKEVVTEECDLKANWDYTFFKARGMDVRIMDYGALEYVKLNTNAYIVNLMPITNPVNDKNVIDILEKYGFVYYKKDIWITYNGLVNLKKISYGSFWERAKWIGNVENEFAGAQNHARSSMGRYPLRAYVFVCDEIEKVIQAKKEIRELYNIGNYSVHINDTHDEAIQLAETYFNENSLFLINTRPFKYEDKIFEEHIEILKNECNVREINIDRVCGAGSTPMNAFQIRHSDDLDYISLDENVLPNNEIISSHNKYCYYYPYPLEDIINNPEYHMFYNGIKFITLEALYMMKKKRGEVPKDICDCKNIGIVLHYRDVVSMIKQSRINRMKLNDKQEKMVSAIYKINAKVKPLFLRSKIRNVICKTKQTIKRLLCL